ncbi:MAG TPA: CarD family transcriptional regulator, partial [Acidimicrobiia bacterium]|nr:CarD family transcriptional regulator [Acidimicrobiia bacterium]
MIAREPTVAVPDPARALFVAALAATTTRRPILVATPTGAEAERLARDLGQFLGPEHVELFPAWETLPFERVSPSLETMGRRLRVLWKLRTGGEHLPTVVVAPVRALVQRLGPHVEVVEPVVVRAGDRLDRDELVARLVAAGYRREYQVEARGEVAVRGSIVDVYPSTDDHPVRIDLWGDEVERLSGFSVADQRSTHDVESAWIFPTRELLPTDEVRERARALVQTEPWGREQWERLGEGQVFDGMESWLPWLTEREHLLPDLLPDTALALLVEPKRMRDRAQELLDEEASLAATLAGTWGARVDASAPRLSLEFDRLLAHTKAGATSVLSTPENPDSPRVAATAFDPVVGDTDALARRLRALAGEGYRVVLAAEGTGSAQRLHDILAGEGLDAAAGDAAPGAVRLVVAPLERGVILPSVKLALVAEADLTGRRRVHRRARGARKGVDYYDALEPGDYVVHYQHGVGRYLEMKPLTMAGIERDYLWLEFKDGKVYVPTDQVGLVRKYTGGETP